MSKEYRIPGYILLLCLCLSTSTAPWTRELQPIRNEWVAAEVCKYKRKLI